MFCPPNVDRARPAASTSADVERHTIANRQVIEVLSVGGVKEKLGAVSVVNESEATLGDELRYFSGFHDC
jgi:hypothetical protein